MACFLLLSGVHDLTSWRQSPALLTLVNNFIDGGVLPTRHSRGGISLHHWATCFFPASGVHDLTSCQQSPALLTLVNNFIDGGVLPTRHSRGGISLHHWATCFFLLAGVHDLTSCQHLTTGRLTFSYFPGCMTQPCIGNAPRKHPLSPLSGVLPSSIRILGTFPRGTISAEQRMRGIS